MKKTHLYKRSEGKDFIFSSEKEFPKIDRYYFDPIGGAKEFYLDQYMSDTEDWLSTAEKVEVYPRHEYLFARIAGDLLNETEWKNSPQTFPEALENGVIIPPGYVDIRKEKDGRFTYAFFRSPEPDKPQENTESQEELWKEFYDILYDTDLKYHEAEKRCAEKFEIKRK